MFRRGQRLASKLVVLKSLPTPHRDHLFEIYSAHIGEGRLLEPKFEALARYMTDAMIAPYRGLYLHKKGLLSWYRLDRPQVRDVEENVQLEDAIVEAEGADAEEADAEEPLTLNIVARRILRQNPGIERGIQPDLDPSGKPHLFKMSRGHDSLILELAALSNPISYYESFNHKSYRHDQYYVMVLRDDPLSIEIRSSSTHVLKLFNTISSELGMELKNATRCMLGEEQRTLLKNALDASCHYADQTHDDDVFSKSHYESQKGVDLENEQRLKDIEAEDGVDGFSRKYEFVHPHLDGHVEYCAYSVKLGTGEVRLLTDMSELAIARIQSSVVALF